jgi:uncharacterized protein YecE (DUF72 family)
LEALFRPIHPQRQEECAQQPRAEEPEDARRISPKPPRLRASRDVYCYFDNDAKVRAPFDAQRLMQKLGLSATQQDRALSHPG